MKCGNVGQTSWEEGGGGYECSSLGSEKIITKEERDQSRTR